MKQLTPIVLFIGLSATSYGIYANDFKATFQKIGHDAKAAGKEIGKASKEAGQEIAKGSKAIAKDAKQAGNDTKSWWESLWED